MMLVRRGTRLGRARGDSGRACSGGELGRAGSTMGRTCFRSIRQILVVLFCKMLVIYSFRHSKYLEFLKNKPLFFEALILLKKWVIYIKLQHHSFFKQL
jgi:hypothetical protein